MDSVTLNNLNSSFKVDDKHGHTALFILKIVFGSHQEGQPLPPLRLQVIDQDELGLYSSLIPALRLGDNPVVHVEKQFAIFNYLKVEVISLEPGMEFEVVVYFSLMQNAVE